MADALGRGQIAHPQHEIVVLTARAAFAEAANLLDKAAPVDPETAEHVLRQQQVRVPVRFEIRRKTPAFAVDLVFVGVNQIYLRVFGNGCSDFEKRVLGQHIVVVEKRDIATLCRFERRVRSSRDVPVCRAMVDLDARVQPVMVKDTAHLR